MSEQEYIKKTLVNEIEEGLLKGAGINNFTQNDFSNKASETSERDNAIPSQCLRKAFEIGLDHRYGVEKFAVGDFATTKDVNRTIRAEAILENQLKHFFSKIEHNDKLLFQDDSKKADLRWKDRVLCARLVHDPFMSLMNLLKDTRPSLHRALQHHPMVSGKYSVQRKKDWKKSKRERLDSASDNSDEGCKEQKIRKSLVMIDSDKEDITQSDIGGESVDVVEDVNISDDSVPNTVGENTFMQNDPVDDTAVADDRTYSLSCIVAKCVADGSLQAQLITLALILHEYSKGLNDVSKEEMDPVSSLPVGNVLATLFENTTCSRNFNSDGNEIDDEENRKRLNIAHGLAIRNPFKSCLHLHYSAYQRVASVPEIPIPTFHSIPLPPTASENEDSQLNVSVSQSEILGKTNEVGENDSDGRDDSDEDTDDEMLAAALAMSMSGGNTGEESAGNGIAHVEPDEDVSLENKNGNMDSEPQPNSIPLLSKVNPLSTFGPFCESDFWKSVQNQQSLENDMSSVTLEQIMVALLVNIGAGVDKAMLTSSTEGSEDKQSKSDDSSKESKKSEVGGDSLSSLVNSITASLVGEKEPKSSELDTSAVKSKVNTSNAQDKPVECLPIMALTPITPHPISFLLIEVILDMFVSNLSSIENNYVCAMSSEKYFLVWAVTIMLKLLKCNFSLLHAFKIPPATIGLIDPLSREGDTCNSVTSRLLSLSLKCIGREMNDFQISLMQLNPIESVVLSPDNVQNLSSKELTLRQVQHSGVSYMHAIKVLATDVMASGFAIYFPSVNDRMSVLRHLLETTPLNTGVAFEEGEKISPFKTDEFNEYSGYFNFFDPADVGPIEILRRYMRDTFYYDSILLQKLCLSVVLSDGIEHDFKTLGKPPIRNITSDDILPLQAGERELDEEPKSNINNIETAISFANSTEISALERILFNRLKSPDLYLPLSTGGKSTICEEIVLQSNDFLYSDNGSDRAPHQYIGGISPSKSLCYGEICLFRLLSQSYACGITHYSDNNDEVFNDSLKFDPKRCSTNLEISEDGQCLSQTRNKTWSSVLVTEGFEPETGEHSWMVQVDRSDRGHVFIGIATSACSQETYIGGDDQGWGLIGTKALWHNRSKIKSSYGDGFSTGACIRVKYDSDEGKLYFSDNSNETNWGLAFDKIPRCTIYPAISLYQREDKVVIHSCGRLRNTCRDDSSPMSLDVISPNDPFVSVRSFVLFALSVFDTVEDILSFAEKDDCDRIIRVSHMVSALSHPFIILIFPLLSSALVVSKLSPMSSNYLSIHLLPHLTLLTKRLSSIHESVQKEMEEACSENTAESSKIIKMLRNLVHKEFGLIGNISGVWRINSSAGGNAIPAQEYFLQIISSPVVDSPSDVHSDVGVGKDRPLQVRGNGMGQSANVSIGGTVFGTRIRFSENWHMGGTCLIDARLSLDGSSFFGTFKDVKSGIIGTISASRVHSSTTVSRFLSEEDKFSLHIQQSPMSNGQLKAAILGAMACGRLSANLIVGTTMSVPAPSPEDTDLNISENGSILHENENVQDEDANMELGSVSNDYFSQKSEANFGRWMRSELFSEGLVLGGSFTKYVGEQLSGYFSAESDLFDFMLSPKSIDLKLWWLEQTFHSLNDYCVFINGTNNIKERRMNFVFRCATETVASPDTSCCSDSANLNFYHQLQQNTADGKKLDEYVVSHVGLTSLCKIGGDAIQTARRRVLAVLILHSGYLDVCLAEVQSLDKEKDRNSKPPFILLEIWRAAQKVIEYYIRLKQQVGISYGQVSQELCRKSEFLMDIVPNSLCKDVTLTLQSTLSTEFTKKRSFDSYGSSAVHPFEETYNARNLSETVEFLQSSVDVDHLKMKLFQVSMKSVLRSAGFRAISVLLGKGFSGSASSSTMSPSRMPALSTLTVQSAVVEYVLPSIYGICDFTSDLNSKWMTDLSTPSSLFIPPSPKDPTESDEVNQEKRQNQMERDLTLRGHFSDALQGSSAKFLSDLRHSFEVLFELITQLLHRSTWAGDRDGQCVSLAAWDITVIPEDHAFLNRIGIFRVLQTVLDDVRGVLSSAQCERISADNKTENVKFSAYIKDMKVSGSKRLTQLALKIVHSLASQIAFCKDETTSTGLNGVVTTPLPPLNRQVSGPETLSQALFDMLYTELYTSLKQIVSSAHGDKAESETDSHLESSENNMSVQSGPSTLQFEEIGGEKYAYRILRLLFSVSSSAVCRRYLCSPKWLTLLLSGIGSGGLSVQRRLLRLLRKLITSLPPEDISCFVTDFCDKKDDLMLSDRPLDDDDVECLISSSNEISPDSDPNICAENIVKLFLEASTANIVPEDNTADGNNGGLFLLNLYGIPSGTNSLCAESISLLRMLQEVPSWKKTLCDCLRRPLQNFLGIDSAGESWHDHKHLRAVASSMGIMGGYVDRVRVGGTVTLKPFSLVGLSETFALRLAAVSHSCGMVVSKSSKSIELVLMERSRKYLKSEFKNGSDKDRYTAQYVMSLAGGTPIRSVKMTPADVIPTSDVFVPSDFFDAGFFNDTLNVVRDHCLPFLKNLIEHQDQLDAFIDKKKIFVEDKMDVVDFGDEVFGEEFDDDDADSCSERTKSLNNNKQEASSDKGEQHDYAPEVSDIIALQLYVSTISLRSASSWLQHPQSFETCAERSEATIREILQFAMNPTRIGGLSELEAIEERWASVWESYSLLKYQTVRKNISTDNGNLKTSGLLSSLSDSSSDVDSSMRRPPSRSRGGRNRVGGDGKGWGEGGAQGRGLDSGSPSTLPPGMLSSMLSTPSAADATRAREQMMDMGFPKEWCDVALRRCRYNVELAINLCFEHGPEMNQLVAEEAALQSARASSGANSGGGRSSGRQSTSQTESLSILERLANRSRNSDEPSWRVPSMQREGSTDSGSGLSRRRQFFSMGFPKSWCNRALEVCDNDIDASIAWIISHGEELIAAEESADKSDTPESGKSIKELLSAIGNSAELNDDNISEDSSISDESDDFIEDDSTCLFANSPVVDCSNSLSSICGSAVINTTTLSCGGTRSGGFPSVGCRGYAVSSGKWYFEVKLETAGCIQVGWVDVAFTGNADAGEGVGDDCHSWAYDGWRLLKWNGSSAEWGGKWSVGDVVGCAVDMDNCVMSFFLNGFGEEINMGVAFRDFKYLGGLFPCLSYNRSEKCSFTFNGRDFKHNPPEGYRPYAEHIQDKFNQNAVLLKKFVSINSGGKVESFDEQTEAQALEDNKKDTEVPYFYEDSLEEQRGENDFLSHKRYFQPDESRSGNNQLERQCQQMTTKILSAPMPTGRKGLLGEFQKISGELCILYARLMILRILSCCNRNARTVKPSTKVTTECIAKYQRIFLDSDISIGNLMQLIRESSCSSLRTKVYLQTMSILSSSALPPPNLGSVLTVGGMPLLNSLVDAMSVLLITASSGSKKQFLESIVRCVSNELIRSCRREFAADWTVESGGTPVIYKDILMLSTDNENEFSSNISVPSLSLAVWFTALLMQELFVNPLKGVGVFSTEDYNNCLVWVEPLISAWSIALKSPVIAVKMCAARNLSSIIQQFFFVNDDACKVSLPTLFVSKIKVVLADCICLDRIEKLVLHRMVAEKGAHPVCSEYLQCLTEFSVTLRTALDTDNDEGKMKDSENSASDDLNLYPPSKAESDSSVRDFNWDAINGNMLSDDGWIVWTGSVQQLDANFSVPSSQRRMSLSGRHHESIPPALLPGCKVMRHRQKLTTNSMKSTSENEVLSDNSIPKNDNEDASPDNMRKEEEDIEKEPSPNESETSRRRQGISDLQAASDRMRGSIAKLLSERGKRIIDDLEKKKLSGDVDDATGSKPEMEFGTVIGVTAWEGCAPGSARIIKWARGKEDVQPMTNIETVRWGAEGKYDVYHVELDASSKKKKIKTQYPWPTSVEEYAANNGFAADISFGIILRLRSLPSEESDVENDIVGRYDGLMEWPDFKSTVYVTAVLHGTGDWVLKEEKLVTGSADTDWWCRFGRSSWRAGTTYTMSAPTHSAAQHAQSSSDNILLGQFDYDVNDFTGQYVNVAGDIQLQQSQLFSFDSCYHASSIKVSQDHLAASCSGGEGKCIAYANVGFSSGVHYWEFKVEQCDLGNIYVGVAEKTVSAGQETRPRLNKWFGNGFVNMRMSYRHTQEGSGERVYGDIFHTGDTVGVLLDMNRGTLSFFMDGMKYGEHLLTDLGVAFDGLVNGSANSVQPKTLYPVVGFRRSGDRVTITPRWISTVGNLSIFNEFCKVNRAWSLLSQWNNNRPSSRPRERDIWTYREAWRDWLRWRSDRYLKVRTRCRGVSLNLTANLDKSPRACVDASIRLGLSKALFHGDRIAFHSSCGRKLEAKEDAVILGALRGQLWYRLDSQREGDRGAIIEGSNSNLAWCFAPYDVEDIELVRRGTVVGLLPDEVIQIPLARVPVYHGGLLRVVYDQGAVMRGGLEIDAADVVSTIAHDTVVYAIERRVNSSNIARYQVYHDGTFGWISERIRGGNEEYMVSVVALDEESTTMMREMRYEALTAAKGSHLEVLITSVDASSLPNAIDEWSNAVLSLQNQSEGCVFADESGSFSASPTGMLANGGVLSETFRRCSTESFEEFLSLSSTMDGSKHWPVECDMLLAEFVSHTASKEGQSPYNLSCEQITSSLKLLGEKSPLKSINPSRIIARTAVIRVANSLISAALPYFQLVLPEEKWDSDCFGSRNTDINICGKVFHPQRSICYCEKMNKSQCSSCHINAMDIDMNYLGDNSNQLAMNKKHIWTPPCGSRRLHIMRRVLFTQTKKLFWDNILESTTTATPLNQDEYEDPREIKDVRINRVKATQSKLATIGNMSERIRQSVFGQLHREMRQWPASSFRRSYLGKGHGGQCRAFKVKFLGEGVNDYGGPYRAVFEQIVDELQCDTNSVGSKSSDRCLLPLLVPCPNRSTVVGSNQDKFLFSSSASPLIQELMQFFGKLSGTALRHNLNMNLNLSQLLWRPMAQLPISLRHLETIDLLTVKHITAIEKLALELEEQSLQSAVAIPYEPTHIPEEWQDTSFTISLADGSKFPLIPGGEDIPLTLGNWREYIALTERTRLRECSVLYKAYHNGLASVLPVELFSLFSPAELDQLFSGNNTVDVTLLKQCTEYEGISPESELAKNFWSVLEDMSDDDRTSFLRFVWARSRMPASAQDLPMNFKLQADSSLGENSSDGDSPDNYLPHAQTCFFSLSLPNYTTKEALRLKLLYAIYNSPNMDADVRLHNAEGWADV